MLVERLIRRGMSEAILSFKFVGNQFEARSARFEILSTQIENSTRRERWVAWLVKAPK